MAAAPQSEFQGDKFRKGAETFIAADDALDFIEYCREHGFAVVGVEGFRELAGKIQPQMDMISGFNFNDQEWSWEKTARRYNDSSDSMVSTILSETDDRENLYFVFAVRQRAA